MYGWENALYANGLMSPWANAWGAQPQTIADTVVREQVAPALGVRSDSDGRGYSAPGDPGKAAQTSQATKDRVRDSLTGSIGTALGKTALGTGAALAAGMPSNMAGQMALGGLMSPGSIGGVLGGATNATLGTTPDGWMGRTLSAVPGVVGGFLGGPIGGLVGGLAGGPLADAMMDGLNARKEEALRDDMEDKSGYFGGRRGYADLQGYASKANEIEATVKGVVDKVNAVRGIAGLDPVGYSPRGVSTGRMEVGAPGTQSYGGWGNIGGPYGGARSVDRGYGPSMGGFAGLGIGNPSSYGGGGSDRDRGGFGSNDGNSDTAGNAGYGR